MTRASNVLRLVLVLVSTGCATVRVTHVPGAPDPGASVALLGLAGTKPAKISEDLSHGCLTRLRARGLTVETITPRRIGTPRDPGENWYQDVGDVAGIDSFVVGAFSYYRGTNRLEVTFFKLISARTGSIIATALVEDPDGEDRVGIGAKACAALFDAPNPGKK